MQAQVLEPEPEQGLEQGSEQALVQVSALVVSLRASAVCPGRLPL